MDMWTGHNRQDLVRTIKGVWCYEGSFSPGGRLYAALVETYLKFGLKTLEMTNFFLELYATLMGHTFYLKAMSI